MYIFILCGQNIYNDDYYYKQNTPLLEIDNLIAKNTLTETINSIKSCSIDVELGKNYLLIRRVINNDNFQ